MAEAQQTPCSGCPGGVSASCSFRSDFTTPSGSPVFVVTDKPLLNPVRFDGFTRLVQRVGVDPGAALWTSIVKCPDKSPQSTGRTCLPWMWWQIKEHRPPLILTAGEIAYKLLIKAGGPIKSIADVHQQQLDDHKFSLCNINKPDLYAVKPSYNYKLDLAARRIQGIFAGTYPPDHFGDKDYRLINSMQDWVEFEKTLPLLFSFDIETGGMNDRGLSVGTDPYHPNCYIAGFSFCGTPKCAAYVDVRRASPVLLQHIAQKLQQSWLICHNGKFDLQVVKRKMNIDLFQNFWADTMLAHHLLEEWKPGHGLKELTSEFLPDLDGYEQQLDDYFRGVPKNRRDYGKVPTEILGPYGCADADATLRLWAQFEPQLQQL